MDGPASSGARGAARCLGAGEFAGVFGRGDAGDARILRHGPSLHRDGGPGAEVVGQVSAEVEAAVPASHRGAVDGVGTRRFVRARVGRNVAPGEDQVSGTVDGANEKALAAD